MDILQLRAKLARRFRRTCDGANADPSDEVLDDALETARRELSKKFPKAELYHFKADADNVVELVHDVNGVTEPLEVISVTGVYIRDRGWAGLPYQSGPSDTFANPSLGFMDAKLRDSFNRKVDYIRQNNRLKLIGQDYPVPHDVNLWHVTNVGLPSGYRGIILYHAPLQWADIPEWMEDYITKRALIDILESAIINKDGLVRLPSPMGYFEFDGGHNFRQMRDRLRDEWETDTTAGTHSLIHG